MNSAAITAHTMTAGRNGSSWHALTLCAGRGTYHAEALVAAGSDGQTRCSVFDCYRDGGSNQTPRRSMVRQAIDAAASAAALAKHAEVASVDECLALLGLA
jgi:hypothetical protein